MEENFSLEKFVCSLANKDIVGSYLSSCVQDCLREQGFLCDDGKLRKIKKYPDKISRSNVIFEIKRGKWYTCINSIGESENPNSPHIFIKGKAYKSFTDNAITGENGLIVYLGYKPWKYFRPWNIVSDAKDGDVLVAYPPKGSEHNEQFFIFNEIKNRSYVENAVNYYIRMYNNTLYIGGQGYMGTFEDEFSPATDEQRKALFSKMDEEGYCFENGCITKTEQETKKELYSPPVPLSEFEEKVAQTSFLCLCAHDDIRKVAINLLELSKKELLKNGNSK